MLIINCQRLTQGRYQSGQLGQTVNLLAFAFEGSIPSRPTKKLSILESFLVA